jgi:hypothetical protein
MLARGRCAGAHDLAAWSSDDGIAGPAADHDAEARAAPAHRREWPARATAVRPHNTTTRTGSGPAGLGRHRLTGTASTAIPTRRIPQLSPAAIRRSASPPVPRKRIASAVTLRHFFAVRSTRRIRRYARQRRTVAWPARPPEMAVLCAQPRAAALMLARCRGGMGRLTVRQQGVALRWNWFRVTGDRKSPRY